MDFWMTIRVLLKRWYIALPVFAVSLGLAVAVFLSVSPQYESTGTIVLTGPSTGAKVSVGGSQPAEKANPLLVFDGSLTTSAQIVIETLKDPATQKQFETIDGEPAAYEAGNGQLNGPFIVVVATAGSPESAKKLATSVLDLARKELSARQESLQAPESTYIRVGPVVNPDLGKAKIGGKVRYAAVALVLGLVAGLTAAYGFESYKNYKKTHPGKEKAAKADKQESTLKQPEAPQPVKQAEAPKPVKQPEPSWPAATESAPKSEETTRILTPVAKPTPSPRARDPR
ncbi:hypothetical protein [Amycolatopsis sp. NPDC059657]|uniref:hypothetical protein n=1 Tax=Amycolatopsis sp. NPDC059657 TaxID=3346899 RepID=UPI00366B20C1